MKQIFIVILFQVLVIPFEYFSQEGSAVEMTYIPVPTDPVRGECTVYVLFWDRADKDRPALHNPWCASSCMYV